MGWGSAGPPPWVDEGRQSEEEHAKKTEQYLARIAALEKENEALKTRVKQLEDELNKTNK